MKELTRGVIINESIIGDIFGFNYHAFSCHIHLGAETLENFELLAKIIMAPFQRNNIATIKGKSYDHIGKHGANTTCIFQTLF